MSYSIFKDTMVEMTWQEVEKEIQAGAIVLLPTGVIEEHGPHMSLGVDTYLSYLACKLVKQKLQDRGIEALIAPPYYWGINNVTGAFPGSFTVRKETLKAILYDILASFKRWGVNHVFTINWHDDHRHCSTLLKAIDEARVGTGIRAYSILSDMLAKHLGLSGKEEHVLVYQLPPEKGTAPIFDIHAGASETAIMVKYFPEEVDISTARKLKATNLTTEEFALWRQGWSDTRKVTPLGYLGNPAYFHLDDGKQFVEALSQSAASLIEATLNGTYKNPLKQGVS